MAITSEMIKKLRDKTGAGMMDCKHALEESGGSLDAAIEVLRKKGAAVAQKNSTRDHSSAAACWSYSAGRVGSVNRCPVPG